MIGAHMPTLRGKPRNYRHAATLLYVAIVFLAAMSDAFTADGTHGALILSTLPIAVIGLINGLIGPWLGADARRVAKRAWITAALLLIAIFAVFAHSGIEAARTGELILTYACVVLALPSSLALPFMLEWTGSWIDGGTWTRVLVMWSCTVLLGAINWRLSAGLRRWSGRSMPARASHGLEGE